MKNLVIVKLENPTKEKWETWKSLESHLTNEAKNKGLFLTDIEYDEENFTKTCICVFDSLVAFSNGVIKMQRCVTKHSIDVSLINKIELEHDALVAISEYRERRMCA